VFERTGSTTWIAVIASASWIPRLLLSSYGGVLADRHDRTRLMVVSALLSSAVMTGLGVAVATDAPLGVILALVVANAAAATGYGSAAQALTPDVVPERDLTAANGLVAALENLNVVVGPAIGALLLAIDEPAAAVFANAATFLVAALLISRVSVRSRGDATEEGQNALKAFLDGVSAVRAHRTAVVLVLFCALDTAVFGALTVLNVPISEQLGTGADGYGYLVAGMALGGVVSASVANRLSASRRLAPVIMGGIVVQAIPVGLMTLANAPAAGFALLFVSGSGMVVVDVLAVTALQRDLPRGVLGRAFSLLDVACLLTIVVVSFAFAALLRATDLDTALLTIGIGFPIVALLGIGPLLRADRGAVAKLRELEPRIQILQVLDLFEAASRPTLERLADSLKVVEAPAGRTVMTEGQPARALWIVAEGEVAVTVGGAFVRTMGPRSYFGEIGLLRGIPRTATVRTTEPSVLWGLSGDDFREALEAHSASASLLGMASSRLARTHPRLATEPAVAPTPS
jgi:MFS family permease